MEKRRFFRFSYYSPHKKDRELLPHMLRDGDAFLELAVCLCEKGYQYGGLILNPPSVDHSQRAVDISFLRPTDIVVLTTRPPLHDELAKTIKPHRPTYSTLEARIFQQILPFFTTCTRSLVELSPHIATQLPERMANRAYMTFKQRYGSSYITYGKNGLSTEKSGKPDRTAVFMLSIPKKSESDLNIFCTFGMGGTESLIWAYLLRTRFSEMVNPETSRFVMAEMVTEPLPPKADNLSFVDKWQVDFLLDIPLP